MKTILLALFMFIGMGAYAQTTAWSTSPPVTSQTRTLSGSKQIRWIWGSNNIFSLPDTLAKYNIPSVIISIVGGVTNNGIVVTHTGMVNPVLIFRNADGSNYGGAQNNVDNGTSITLTGDSDGSGHFADSFMVILKP